MSALVVTNTVKGAARRANGGTDERELDPEHGKPAQRASKRAGYKTVLKGKWHLTQPVGSDWSQADAERLADEYGFEGWVPPDAGENIEPSHFGGGNKPARARKDGDEGLHPPGRGVLADPPDEPLGADLLARQSSRRAGYPSSYEEGGYSDREWADLDAVQLPPSVDETMKNKPRVHSLLKIGQLSFLGPIEGATSRVLPFLRPPASPRRRQDRPRPGGAG